MANVTQIYRSFKGWNPTSALDSLLPTELVTAQNLLYAERGGYSKAPGRVRYNANALDANSIKRLIPHFKKDGTIQKFYNSGTKLWKDNGDNTFTAIKSDLSAEITDFFSWTDDKLYFLSGGNYYSTDGITVNAVTAFDGTYDLTGVKRCTMHVYYSGWFRHFFAGDTQDRSALYYSNDTDPSKIKSGATSTAKVYPAGVNLGAVTALAEHKNAILVGYKRGWFRWLGGGTNPAISADWRRVPASSGPIANKATSPVREAFAYASDDGVYILESLNTTAEDNSRKISKDIDKYYRALTNKSNMTMLFDGRYLYLAACTGAVAYNDVVLVADFDIIDEEGQPAWSLFSACYASDFMLIDGVVYFAHSNNGLIMKFDSTNYNNDGAAMHMKAEHNVTLSDKYGTLNPFALHKIKSVLLAVKQYSVTSTCTITVTCDYDDKAFSVNLNESMSWGQVWGNIWGIVDFLGKEGPVNKKARRIKIAVENNVLNEPLTVYALGLEYRPGKTKGTKHGVTTV